MSDMLNRKQAFRKWLEEHSVKGYTPEVIIQAFDDASTYAVKRKLSSVELWDIKDAQTFNKVRAQLLGMRLFRLMHRNAAITLDKTWKCYSAFLEELEAIEKEQALQQKLVDTLSVVVEEMPANKKPLIVAETNDNEGSELVESSDATASTMIKTEDADDGKITHEVEVSAVSSDSFVIRKNIDKSLLKAGMTIPKSASEEFLTRLGITLAKGEKRSIEIVLEDTTYQAQVISLNFSEKYADVTMLQVRYSASSPICQKLNELFSSNSSEANASEDYIDVYVDAPGRLRFECHANSATVTTNTVELDSSIVTEAVGETTVNVDAAGIAVSNNVTTDGATNAILLDLTTVKNLSYTKVVSVKMFGEQAFGVQFWRDVFLFVVKMLYARKSDFFEKLRNRYNVRGVAFNFTSDKSRLRYPLEITDGFYVEGNLSATDIGRRIKILFDIMAVPQSELEVYYVRNTVSPEAKDASRTTGGLNDFYVWLTDEEKMAPASCRGYVSSLKSISEYAVSTGILQVRLDAIDDIEELKQASEILYNNLDYRDYNAQQHNRFSAAISKYLVFKGIVPPHGRRQINAYTEKPNASTSVTVVSEDSTGYREGVEQLLKTRFKYGFRLTSDMDIMRMRQFAEMQEVELPESDETLKMLISVVGFKVDDKVFVVADETIEFLKAIVAKYAEAGARVFFYEALMLKEYEELNEHQISSDEMLKELLVKHCSGYTFSKNFMMKGNKQSEMDAVVSELQRVWGEGLLRTFDDLHEMLPMIPMEKIKYMLSYSDLFVWNSQETYAFINNVAIVEEEKKAIVDFVRSKCEINGFASLSDIPLGSIAEVNYELSNTALYAAIFNRVLIKKFRLNGKILTFPGKSISAVFLVKSFCSDKDECTFDELHEKVIELTGGINRQIAFEAGYDTMIRVRQNKFVADRFVDFDVATIDSLLDELIDGDFLSVKGIATFAAFPVCGQPWNHYLLESYCHRYSKKYRLAVMNYNDKNAGIIVKKTSKLKYKDMLAIVASKADIPLTEESVGAYLCSAGYMAKSKYAGMGDIVDQAKVLREENQ